MISFDQATDCQGLGQFLLSENTFALLNAQLCSGASYSPDGLTVAIGGSNGTVKLIDTRERVDGINTNMEIQPSLGNQFFPNCLTLACAAQ